MLLLPRRCVLAMAAVIDIAVNARPRPVAAKALAARHHLPPRHLETLLQSLVHAQILRGVRGPHGGYELARDRRKISAGDIVRAALAAEGGQEEGGEARSPLIDDVVTPLMVDAGKSFLSRLDTISVEELSQGGGTKSDAAQLERAEAFNI